MAEQKPQVFVPPNNQTTVVHLTNGHAARVEPGGTEIHPRFFKEAIRMGCVPKNMKDAIDDSEAGDKKNVAAGRSDVIKEKMHEMVKNGDDDDFLNDGRPDLRALNDRVGFDVQKEDRDKLWAEVAAEAGLE